MKTKHVFVLLFILTLCLDNGITQEKQGIGDGNPSGVWLLWGEGKMNYIENYSWGKNPTYNQATVIDLGDDPPYVFHCGAWVSIDCVWHKGNYYYLDGVCDEQKVRIQIYFKDRDTMWFVKFVPGCGIIGEKYYYKRVPINAPVFPIDPDKGP